MLLHVQYCLAGLGTLLHMHASIVHHQFAYWLVNTGICCAADQQVQYVTKDDI